MVQRYHVGDQPKAGFEVSEVIPGSMGIVYILGCKTQPDFKLAMKSCTSETAMTPESKARIQREAFIWISLLPHPNVVSARSFEFDRGLPTLILDYIAGGNLRTHLSNSTPTLPDFLRIALEFCEGMVFLGSNDIVHRDIKPENILLTKDGHVKVTDFGLANALHPAGRLAEEYSSKQAHSNDFEGTLPYMAPEQFASFHTADHRADVYSFGIVLYEMLGGQRPFREDSAGAIRKFHEHTTPPELPDHIPFRLRQIVMQCLAKKPDDRVQTFAALFDEIAEFSRISGFATSIPEHHSIAGIEQSLDSSQWKNRGYALSQLGDFDGALQSYDRAIEAAKTKGESEFIASVYDNMGALLLRMGRAREGKKAFEEALRIAPDNGVAYLRLGQIELHSGQTSTGLALMKKSVECEPGHIDLLLKYLIACYQFNSHEEFESGFRRLLEAKKSDAPFLVTTGCHLDDLLGAKIALRCFDTVLKTDADNVGAWYNKAITLHRVGKENDALTAYQNVVRLHRHHALARCYMGVILLKQGRTEEAAWNLQQFLQYSDASPLRETVVLAERAALMGVPLESLLAPLTMPEVLKHIS